MATRIRQIAPVRPAEAGRLAATEYARFGALLQELDTDQWGLATDCPPWDVRRLVAHVLGATEANATPTEMVDQLRHGRRGVRFGVDQVSAYQVARRQELDPEQLVERFQAAVEPAVRWRTRLTRWVPWLPVPVGEPLNETWRLGYLTGIIYTRDTWMHRIDICRATGRALELTASHDGRVVADLVAEWARRHGRPIHLTLTGPAGGEYEQSGDGDGDRDGGVGVERLAMDAVEFARRLAGRGEPPLGTPVPF